MSKNGEIFNLNVPTTVTQGTIFAVPDYLTTEGMTIQVSGTFVSSFNIQGSLDGTAFADLTGTDIWWLADSNGTFTAISLDRFLGSDMTHLRVNTTIATSGTPVLDIMLKRRDRAFPYTRP